MNNAEEKLRELVKKTIEIAEAASHMSDTIDMLLSILEPGDLMEMGYEEYLQEYRKANDRNITDELKADIDIQELLCTVEYDYPAFHLSMDCFLCTLVSSSMTLVEAEDAKWLSLQELDSLNWLPADQSILQTLRQRATASTC